MSELARLAGAAHPRRRADSASPTTWRGAVHPRCGYYATRDPLGARGDFITAPEVSQIFGELIGLWCADLWQRMGAPDPVLLVELGPGRGTLMADALRAARVVPGFRAARSRCIWSSAARCCARAQAATLADASAALA